MGDAAALQRRAGRRCEHKIIVVPAKSGFSLARLMRAEALYYLGRQNDGPTTARRLRLNHLEATSFNPLERHPDPEDPCLQVHVLPVEAKSFALAQPDRERQGIESFKPVAAGRFEHRAGLSWAYRANVTTHPAPRTDPRSDIPLHPAPLHC